ncbi:probable disease resistance protein At4g27220 [Prosopis cineraria]|uniref:probable disease resistance protein At4g27220 n=1 Tax=Prosopis cineraria TaxID=364024 RepID=UPI0024105E86|nr:probable disease resistance protein At4g27220 [Prosopis cineraria]
MKALEDENCNMVGLQGLGRTGKTSMALKVGENLEGSQFDKVIFLVVSKPPDFKNIRREIARRLDLKSNDDKEEELSKRIWSKITSMEEKLLVILDDMWEEFDLKKELGIPFVLQRKGCSVLITTRNLNICQNMGCQKTIQLEKLHEEDALKLFHTNASINNSTISKSLVQDIVKQCGGVPVAIVAVARMLKNWPPNDWKIALKTLKSSKSILDVNDENLKDVDKCLKLSYDNLKKEKAKKLFLISSMFPEDEEIPVQVLSKIGIGLSSFGENDKDYSERILEVHAAIRQLTSSSLLLSSERDLVKMHDLVREVALRIEDKYIQSITDLKKPIKENLRYLLWKNDNFPDEFNGKKLEFLLIFLSGSEDLDRSETFFNEMRSLKVFILDRYSYYPRIQVLSLANSLQSLKEIQTLILKNLELGDISILGNLLSLETLWFYDCSIIKLPIEFLKLKKLRSLEVEECEIEENNPFKVLERCSQLEELIFIGNRCDEEEEEDAISQNGSPLTLHKYCISSNHLSYYFQNHGSMLRCFIIDELSHLVSDATFKKLVKRAELLILEGEHEQRIWKNLVPDLVAIDEEETLNDLIILHLSSYPHLECLVDTNGHNSGVTAFCNLVELHLSRMDIEDLFSGSQPSNFLEQLEIMRLKECQKLRSIFSKSNFNLCHLKSIELEDCPMLTTIFQPCTAQSLKELKELTIRNCNELEHIIVGEDGNSNQKSYDSLFLKLITFQIKGCNKLRVIFPILYARGLPPLEKIGIYESEQLEYIFDKLQEGEDAMLPSLKEMELCGVPRLSGIFRNYEQLKSSSMQKPSSPLSRHKSNNIHQIPTTCALSWVRACCSLNKSRPASEETNLIVSHHGPLDRTNLMGLFASKKWIDTAAIIGGQLFLVCHIKKMKLVDFSLNSKSTLFTLSMASMILWEELTIKKCDGLKHLVTNDEDDYKDQKNCSSIFPNLKKLKIKECNDMDFLFPSTISLEIKNLRSWMIRDAPKLTHIVGQYHHEDLSANQNQQNEQHFDLPTLEFLCFKGVPSMISICVQNYYFLVSPSLHTIFLDNCGIISFTDLIICPSEECLNWEITKETNVSRDGVTNLQAVQGPLTQSLKNIKDMKLQNCSKLLSLFTLPTASTILLENLTIQSCHQLKYIVEVEDNAQVSTKCRSIFPTLKNLEIDDCKGLGFLSPSSLPLSVQLKSLKSLTIKGASELKCAIGKYEHEDHLSSQNQHHEMHFDLPALVFLCFQDVPNMG